MNNNTTIEMIVIVTKSLKFTALIDPNNNPTIS